MVLQRPRPSPFEGRLRLPPQGDGERSRRNDGCPVCAEHDNRGERFQLSRRNSAPVECAVGGLRFANPPSAP